VALRAAPAPTAAARKASEAVRNERRSRECGKGVCMAERSTIEMPASGGLIPK
jgi:hypothetical protein